jgi:hypothetical protein
VRISHLGSVLLVCALGAASPAAADPIVWRLDGKVTHAGATAAGFVDAIPVGSDLTLLFGIDPDATHQALHDALPYARYLGAITSYTVIANGLEFTRTDPGGIPRLWIGDTASSDWLLFEIENQVGDVTGPTWGRASFDYLYLMTRFPSDTWSGYGIPGDLNHEIADVATLYFRNRDHPESGRGTVAGTLTQIRRVPEPSTLLLMSLGCAAALRLRRPRH